MSNYRLITRLERFNLSRQGPKGERGSPRSANSLPCFGLLVGRPIRDVPFPFERETAYLKAQPALSGSLPPSPSAESRVAAVWAPSLRPPVSPLDSDQPPPPARPRLYGISPRRRLAALMAWRLAISKVSLSPSLVLFSSPLQQPKVSLIDLSHVPALPSSPRLGFDGNESWDTFLGKSRVSSHATN
jgi:hypothetical protein